MNRDLSLVFRIRQRAFDQLHGLRRDDRPGRIQIALPDALAGCVYNGQSPAVRCCQGRLFRREFQKDSPQGIASTFDIGRKDRATNHSPENIRWQCEILLVFEPGHRWELGRVFGRELEFTLSTFQDKRPVRGFKRHHVIRQLAED